MSKLSFRARALDASKPMPIYLAEELPDLPDYSAINRAVPQMPSGMEKEEESEHHLQRAISGTGLIIPTPEVCQVIDLEFYERCYPPDYKMPKQHIHMQPLWEEQEAPEYDIDSEDERWLKQQRHPELTELKFEQMMDKLEKSSGQTVVTLNEAKLLLERHDDLVIAVYDYWLNKRLNTQHPLILSVKTENRPGQSANNPYLAFRRRTEKMQTRKNRKNDESSYEKMLKLRRDLARALSLLELVARRERAKRELVRLTALIAERRYAAGDFAHHLHHDPPPRPVYTPVPLTPSNFRREPYPVPHYPPRPPPTPVDQPRQREKRPYKRRKHRHPVAGSAQGLRDSGVYSSSEEEAASRVEAASPPDDGPFAFRRKPGCYYEMPTSTLYGDPVDPDDPSKEGLYEHEVDERHRYTLTSVRCGATSRCVGMCRLRAARGGRVALDRVRTPLDDLWPRLRFPHPPHSAHHAARLHEEVEFETKGHRMPKELVRDYHESGKYPWRHAFRRHLARNPELWTCPVKDEPDTKPSLDALKLADVKPTGAHVDATKLSLADEVRPHDVHLQRGVDVKPHGDDGRLKLADMRPNIDDIQPSLVDMRPLDDVRPYLDVVKPEPMDVDDKSDISDSARTIDEYVRENLARVLRKRTYSGTSDCSDNSAHSDQSLNPVEREFQEFIDEVHSKWVHYRAQSPAGEVGEAGEAGEAGSDRSADEVLVGADAALCVELSAPDLPAFVSAEFSLRSLRGEAEPVLDLSDQLLPDFAGFSEAQMESILSETVVDDDKKLSLPDDLLDQLVSDVDAKDSFLLQGQSPEGRADSGCRKRKSESFGSSVVSVCAPKREPLYMDVEITPPAPVPPTPAPPPPAAPTATPTPAPAPVPTHNIILEEVNEVPMKVDKKKKEECVEEVQVAPGVQLKTVQTKHSPLKKHIITSAPRRASDDQPQILTVAVSDSLKVRLQNHLLSTQAGVLVQNGPFPPVAVAVPVQPVRDSGVPGVAGVTGVASVASVVNMAGVTSVGSVAGGAGVAGVAGVAGGSARRVSAPLVQLAPAALAHKPLQLHAHPHAHAHAAQPLVVAPSHALHHVPPNKLKVVHANSLTQSQRTQLLAQNRVAHLPTVVSLATLADAKTPNAALLKAAPGSVAQLFEIKSGQIGKAAHLVNVVRHPTPGKTTVARLDLNDKKRQVVATFDGAIKTAVATPATATATATATRPHRVSVSLDGRQIVRASLPTLPHHVRHQIQLKNRLQVAGGQARSATEPSTSITIAAPPKPTCLPSSMVANLLHKNVQLPKGGQKIAVSGLAGQALSANVQAIAFTTATQLKARQARLIAQPRAAPVAEMVEASTAPVPAASAPGSIADAASPAPAGEEAATNGTVRRRAADTLPMEVT